MRRWTTVERGHRSDDHSRVDGYLTVPPDGCGEAVLHPQGTHAGFQSCPGRHRLQGQGVVEAVSVQHEPIHGRSRFGCICHVGFHGIYRLADHVFAQRKESAYNAGSELSAAHWCANASTAFQQDHRKAFFGGLPRGHAARGTRAHHQYIA
jgi:hypothetical protein